MQATVFNPIQLHLLQMFSHIHTERELQEVQTLLSNYFFDRVDSLGAELAAKNNWTPEALEAMSHQHLRTAYR